MKQIKIGPKGRLCFTVITLDFGLISPGYRSRCSDYLQTLRTGVPKPVEVRDFVFSIPVQSALGFTLPPLHWVTRLFLEEKDTTHLAPNLRNNKSDVLVPFLGLHGTLPGDIHLFSF